MITSVPAVEHILHFPLYLVFNLDGIWLQYIITCSLPVWLKQGDVEDIMNFYLFFLFDSYTESSFSAMQIF